MMFAITLAVFAISMGFFLYNVWKAYGTLPDQLLESVIEPANTTMNRLVLYLVVSLLMFLNLQVASKALTHEEAQQLTSLFVVGPFEIGVYSLIGLIMTAWALTPMVVATVRTAYLFYKHGDELAEDEFWGETA